MPYTTNITVNAPGCEFTYEPKHTSTLVGAMLHIEWAVSTYTDATSFVVTIVSHSEPK